MLTFRFGTQIDMSDEAAVDELLVELGDPVDGTLSESTTQLVFWTDRDYRVTLTGTFDLRDDDSQEELDAFLASPFTGFLAHDEEGVLFFSITGVEGQTLEMFDNDTWQAALDAQIADGVAVHGSSAGDVLVGDVGPDQVNGNGGADELFGLGGNDTLSGGAGNDILDGGTGNDSMSGNAGSDQYYVNSSQDAVIESASQGTDLVYSSRTYTLPDNVERLTLTGTATIHGTGNSLANVITGNSAGNTLKGEGGNDALNGVNGVDTLYGGAGNDVLDGGTGNDNLRGDDGADTLRGFTGFDSLTGGAGNDTLYGEDAADTLSGGTGNDILVGGAGTDKLIGGDGADRLDGSGGADTMTGNLGADRYTIDQAGDKVVEAAGGGIDWVLSTISVSALAANVEKLQLLGSADLDGSGNSLDNTLMGNAGDNDLFGRKGNDTLHLGRGADTATGGDGADVFLFNFAPSDGGIADRVMDFGSADTIQLQDSIFTALDPGALDPGQFIYEGDSPAGGDDYLVYDQADGFLYYDASGAGNTVVMIAAFGAGTSLTAADIDVI